MAVMVVFAPEMEHWLENGVILPRKRTATVNRLLCSIAFIQRLCVCVCVCTVQMTDQNENKQNG